MAYINTETLQYPISELDIRSEYPNTSFVAPFNPPEKYSPVLESPIPQFNTITQMCKEVTPTQDKSGNWVKTYEIVDLSEEQIAYNEELKKRYIKDEASRLLLETDYLESPSVRDTSLTPHLINFDEILSYRLALRAIAINPQINIEMPIKPENQWSS